MTFIDEMHEKECELREILSVNKQFQMMLCKHQNKMILLWKKTNERLQLSNSMAMKRLVVENTLSYLEEYVEAFTDDDIIFSSSHGKQIYTILNSRR